MEPGIENYLFPFLLLSPSNDPERTICLPAVDGTMCHTCSDFLQLNTRISSSILAHMPFEAIGEGVLQASLLM
jgi:hypothetical protein